LAAIRTNFINKTLEANFRPQIYNQYL